MSGKHKHGAFLGGHAIRLRIDEKQFKSIQVLAAIWEKRSLAEVISRLVADQLEQRYGFLEKLSPPANNDDSI